MPILSPIWGRTHTLDPDLGPGLWSIMSVLMLTSILPNACMYFCCITQLELGVSTIWMPLPISDKKMNGLLSSVWLVAVLASLWDVALFPHRHWHVRTRGAVASSGCCCKPGLFNLMRRAGLPKESPGSLCQGCSQLLIYNTFLENQVQNPGL